MTSVKIFRKSGGICGVEISGHSGYGEQDDDIVCAALTAAVRLVEATLNGSMKLDAEVSVDEESATISVLCDKQNARHVFDGFRILMEELCVEYPQFINISEV